jgi:tetratricopeptide (TPR) repeat protein
MGKPEDAMLKKGPLPRLLRWRRVAGLLFGLLLTMSSAAAHQQDSRLPALFERLRTTANPDDAAAAEQQIWQIWIESEDRSVTQLMQRGVAAMSQGQPETALRSFDSIIEQAPEFAEAWNKRATVLYLLGRFEDSIHDIQETLRLEPRHFGALSGLALIYDAIDQPRAALRSLEAALKINPHLTASADRLLDLREKLRGQET